MNEYATGLMIFGCGYLGLRVAHLWRQNIGPVCAVTRSSSRSNELTMAGIAPVIADVMNSATLLDLPRVTHVLHCIGYDRMGPHSKESVYVDGLTQVLEHLPATVQRIVFVSSSSVYGQDSGEWVDENSPTEPQSEGGRICLRAEQSLRSHDLSSTVLRLSGLYGPGRLLARIDALHRGEMIGGNPDAWLNLIHVEDAARACQAALTAKTPAPLYLVSDSLPVQRFQYYSELANRVGAPAPQYDHRPTERHVSGGVNKRCCSALIQRELSLHWLHPGFLSGLDTAIDTREGTP